MSDLAAVSAALSVAEARRLFLPFAPADRVLLAVSGGPDSVAMMGLAASLSAHLPRLAVASVDHGLAQGSRAVAESVVAQAAGLGLEAAILTWRGAKPTTGIQEAARIHRYRLVVAHAREIGAAVVATAHTLDDQAETLLFRMSRGSGVAGLAGMAPRVMRGSVAHVRPFLDVPKDRLVATCRANGWAFADDPANADRRFARARLRTLLPALAEEGLDRRRFGVLARRFAEAAEAIDQAAGRLLAVAARPEAPGCYAAELLVAEPAAVLTVALERVLAEAGARPRSRLQPVERLAGDLRSAVACRLPLRRNLLGALLDYDGRDRVSVRPEPPRHHRPPSRG